MSKRRPQVSFADVVELRTLPYDSAISQRTVMKNEHYGPQRMPNSSATLLLSSGTGGDRLIR